MAMQLYSHRRVQKTQLMHNLGERLCNAVHIINEFNMLIFVLIMHNLINFVQQGQESAVF